MCSDSERQQQSSTKVSNGTVSVNGVVHYLHFFNPPSVRNSEISTFEYKVGTPKY